MLRKELYNTEYTCCMPNKVIRFTHIIENLKKQALALFDRFLCPKTNSSKTYFIDIVTYRLFLIYSLRIHVSWLIKHLGSCHVVSVELCHFFELPKYTFKHEHNNVWKVFTLKSMSRLLSRYMRILFYCITCHALVEQQNIVISMFFYYFDTSRFHYN